MESIQLCCGKPILEYFPLHVNKNTESFQYWEVIYWFLKMLKLFATKKELVLHS